jgi:tetratricopeptide (TPR) repeat protein
MKLRGYLIALAWTLVTATHLIAQDDKQQLAVLDSIYNWRFEESKDLLNQLDCDPIQKQLLDIYGIRWEYLPVTYSPQKHDYLLALTALNTKLESDKGNGRDGSVITSLLLAEYYFTEGKKLKAMDYLSAMYPKINRSFRDSVVTAEMKFVQGIYLYYAGHYSETNVAAAMVLSTLRPGDKEKGKSILRALAFSSTMVGTEAAIYYFHILLHFEKDYDHALEIGKSLAEKYPRNLKFKECYIESLLAVGDYTNASTLLQELKQPEHAFFKTSSLLFEGIIDEQLNKTASAKQHYQEAIENSERYPVYLSYYRDAAEKRLERLR